MELHLLSQVDLIMKKHEAIARVTGENFNIFNVLALSTAEVRTHSAFLAELLNPKGNHDMGEIFLDEFLNVLKEKTGVAIDFNLSGDVRTARERWLGAVTADGGGYIDILLTDSHERHIIVENKIYAADQPNQLKRYHSFDPEAPIIYLTLLGDRPSDESIGADASVKRRVVEFSYRDDITPWLEKCKHLSVDHSRLRETVKQYISLIKELTGRSATEAMETEITNTIIDAPLKLKSALALVKSMGHIKKALLDKLVEGLRARAQESIDSNCPLTLRLESSLSLSGISLAFSNPVLERNNLKIAFHSDRRDLDYGVDLGLCFIDLKDPRNQEIGTQCRGSVGAQLQPYKSNEIWPLYTSWSRGGFDDEAYLAIRDGSLVDEMFRQVAEVAKLTMQAFK